MDTYVIRYQNMYWYPTCEYNFFVRRKVRVDILDIIVRYSTGTVQIPVKILFLKKKKNYVFYEIYTVQRLRYSQFQPRHWTLERVQLTYKYCTYIVLVLSYFSCYFNVKLRGIIILVIVSLYGTRY